MTAEICRSVSLSFQLGIDVLGIPSMMTLRSRVTSHFLSFTEGARPAAPCRP